MICPICNCEIENLTGLKLHIKRMHSLNPCPLCGKTVKSILVHLRQSNDEKHKQLWAILTKNRNYVSQNGKEMIKQIRDEL